MNYIDMHSHILPAMDDGSKSMEMTLAMLRIAEQEGIGTIYATPHCMPGKGHPTLKKVEERIQQVSEAAWNEGIDIELKKGTEYYYVEEMLEWLEDGNVITLGDSQCILVEFEPIAERTYIRNAIREILGFNYQPVIAHVERYPSLMEKNFSTLSEMKEMGALIQVNCDSVINAKNWNTKRMIKKILQMELVDFVSTDSHRDHGRAPYMKKCADALAKKYGESYARALTGGNAEKYLNR